VSAFGRAAFNGVDMFRSNAVPRAGLGPQGDKATKPRRETATGVQIKSAMD
jgi:hypothetical protein